MDEPTLIPASPTEDDYVRQIEQAGPQPLLSDRDPFALFAEWLVDAVAKEPNDGNAMALATVDDAGVPDVRMVLLKDASPQGFVFYTNLDSAKGRQLAAHPKAALLFHWKSLRRQVRVRGAVQPVSAEEADAYFATRARPAQLGAWASDQSRPLPEAGALTGKIAKAAARFGLGAVPRPPHWSGFRLVPDRFEFWRDRPFRLHERLVFETQAGGWANTRLYP